MSEEIIQFDDPHGLPPREPATIDPNYIKHVNCDGARWHILSYGRKITCSEPCCIINKP